MQKVFYESNWVLCRPQAGVHRLWYAADSGSICQGAETQLPAFRPHRGHRLVLQRWPTVAWIWIPGKENLSTYEIIWFSWLSHSVSSFSSSSQGSSMSTSSITSRDVEHQFSLNPQGSLSFTVGSTTYTLDFSSMWSFFKGICQLFFLFICPFPEFQTRR